MEQIHVKESLLKVNDFVARELRERFTSQGSYVVNLLSSPGAGKTSLLEASLPALAEDYRVLVFEGDLETQLDAQRIRNAGIDALQITTGGACHLEAHQILQAFDALSPEEPYDFIFIENVGNLVCPASYDLGEHLRVVLLSVPEGQDKPPKYPAAFRGAQAMALTKIDVLDYFDFDPDEAERLAREIQPDIDVLRLSAKTGDGIPTWLEFLRQRREERLAAR
ncbi:hydrogenase accessory protein HypB [bacterium]|nr:MAG: hydrogenase accessory protein HypB [bacterium]RKZ16518.1 MAG: hydrogenase accessory protein HypB [bacterium]